MAAGGRDSESTPLGSDGTPPGGGSAPSSTYQFTYSQMNMHTHQLHTPHLTAQNVGVQGPVILNMNPYARYQPRHQRPDVEDQALWTIPPQVDVSDQFSEDELNRTIEEKFLSFVANSCDDSANWRRLARKLKLDAPSLTRLEQNYGDSIREFIYQLLLTWKRRNPDARVRQLIKVLSDSKLQKPALELKKYFSSIH
ncbi:uncharacterized protein [Littorina saxatilis]|uniref:Death domain-containing protein n=1 Tax=Littorina saxatilis TaxID=31220 RepID=A0AAN9AU15_9CAEN